MKTETDLLIIEDDGDGHRLRYVRLILNQAVRRGLDVTVVLSAQAMAHPAYVHFSEGLSRDACQIVKSDDGRSVRGVNALIAKYDPRFVIVPDADVLTLAVALSPIRLRRPTTLLVMRDPRLEAPRRWRRGFKLALKEQLLRVASRRVNARVLRLAAPGQVVTTDSTLVIDPVSANIPPGAVAEFRALHGLDDTRFWFGIVGTLTPRKGLSEVLGAFALLDPTRFGLLLCGPVSQSFALQLRDEIRLIGEKHEIRLVDEVLSDTTMNVGIAAVGCVVVAYDTSAPPSTMGKAAAIGCRLIVAGPPILHEFASQLSGGAWISAPERSIPALSEAFGRAPLALRSSPRVDLLEDRFTGPLLEGPV